MSSATISLDVGDLDLGSGLLALLRPLLRRVEPGSVVVLRSTHPKLTDDLAAWCRLEKHELRRQTENDGVSTFFIEKGTFHKLLGERETDRRLVPKNGVLSTAALIDQVPFLDKAAFHSGFAPRGAQVEVSDPSSRFLLQERNRFVPPDVGQLYDQAVDAQWNGNRDIPWNKAKELPLPLEHAVCQLMTFLAENELSALYVPSRFISQIHPHYSEVAMLLATQMHDEARHIDVFLKRARLGGLGVGMSAALSARSLLSLLEPEDMSEALFLLSVLGEGTFIDLLKFIEDHAPDPVTEELARRTRADETRHVHFGLSHVRHALAHDPSLATRLEAAVRRRAAALGGEASVPAAIQDSLTILAARGTDSKAVRVGHQAFSDLLNTMHKHRIKRLESAGFTTAQANILSDLHTANFM